MFLEIVIPPAVTVTMTTTKWINLMDWGCDEYLDARCIGERKFQFVSIMDMEAACGRDNDGHPKYAAEVDVVDLAILPEKEIASAIESCGWEDMPEGDDSALAEVCRSYGLRAPLWSESSNNWYKLRAEGRREANALLDEDTLAEAMECPVNQMGSTAAEYMVGDINSAMARGVVSGDPSARIVAKMYGIPQDIIDDTRPSDFLPYVMGYMEAMSNGQRSTEEDLAPEYGQGFERGERVREGKAPVPSWIRQG